MMGITATGGEGHMDFNESTGSKLLRVFCALCSLAIAVVLALQYYGLWGNAMTYNETYCPNGPDGEACLAVYDSCQGQLAWMNTINTGVDTTDTTTDETTDETNEDGADGTPEDGADGTPEDNDDGTNEDNTTEEIKEDIQEGLDSLSEMLKALSAVNGTEWTMMFKFNAIFYTILAVQAVLAIIAVWADKLKGLVGFCNCCCTNIVFLVMAIMALVYRFDSVGDLCSARGGVYDSEGNSFMMDGDKFGKLSITSICLVLVYCCCTMCSVRAPTPNIEQ